jgi:small conductance mechanosensitive channel
MTELATDTVSQTIPKPSVGLFDFHHITINYLDRFFNLLPNIFLGLIIFLLSYLLYRFVRIITERAITRAKLTPSVADALITLLKYLILGYGLILGLEPIFPRITSLLTGLGILGVAIGFAAKDTLANLIAGLGIFWDKPFEVGDIVTLDGTTGKVDRISLRSTRLVTTENFLVSIPNQNVINNKVTNLTRLKKQRIAVPFSVGYEENIEAIRSKIQELFAQLQNENRILTDSIPQVVVTDIQIRNLPSAIRNDWIQLEAWIWVDPTDPNAATAFMLREKILGIL